jgi:NTE family protein
MLRSGLAAVSALIGAVVLAGCATRPVNPPIKQADPSVGYRFETRRVNIRNEETLIILAFSGGGTRAAAFSYGALEFLRNTEVLDPNNKKLRLIDSVGVITGVSGGSFTALAYGLYGDELFNLYEKSFLKRNVQGEIFSRTINPGNWGDLWSTGWGRSELAADLYDEILFKGATFADLNRGSGPLIVASATDLSTGSRFIFGQSNFDILCSDLGAVRLSRAAAASSAVPVVLSPVTFNNYGGTCGRTAPPWMRAFLDSDEPPRPAARAIRSLRTVESFADSSSRPFLHLIDGGVSDNVGMRGVLGTLELVEALRESGQPTLLDRVKQVIVVIVNSLSSPPTDWDKREQPPGAVEILLKSSGVPIDNFSFESIELLRDMSERWRTLRQIRNSPAFNAARDPAAAAAVQGPDARIYAIDVSFAAVKDKAEFEYLNQLPTSFVLPDEAVDRLRAAAGKVIMESPEFHRLLKDLGARIVPTPATAAMPAATVGK